MIEHFGERLVSQAKALKTGNLALDTQLTLTANVPIADLIKNTVRNMLSGHETLTEILKSGGDTSKLLGSFSSSHGSDSSTILSETSELASKMIDELYGARYVPWH
ncbi:hypothetical protein PITC_039290 [Penicillium italicum]|uniref:Uncharacterized protein n=1 Tax=Penicillium italicum TaxID=40296 RepID=A0A0A2L3F9_PENIT|nr:hypothetical protein PITC_039290 [Penicillium italicum]